MIDYRTKHFIWLRVIATIVVLTFSTTQFDIQLAFAYPTQTPLPPDISQDNLKDNLTQEDLFGNVRYSQDFRQRPDIERPGISPQSFQPPDADEPQPETRPDFDNPLGTTTGLTCTTDATDGTIQTCTIPNANSPDCSVSGAVCAYYKIKTTSDGTRIFEIGDFTNPEMPEALEVREFFYDVAGQLTIITRGITGQVDLFQTYSLVPTTYNPDQLLRSGVVVEQNNEDYFSVLRSYNWEDNELTIYDEAGNPTQVWRL